MDNLQLLNSSVQEGREIQTTIQGILEQHSLTLKEVNGDPIDLRDPYHGQTVLGLIPTWRRDLHFSIPESAFQKMENGLTQALSNNHPSHVATQIVEGWLRAIGPVFLNTDARNIIRRVMDSAAGLGFREFSRERLLHVADQARKSWLEIRRVTLSRRQSEQEVRSP